MNRARATLLAAALALGAIAALAPLALGATAEPTTATRGLATRLTIEYPHTLRPMGDQTSRSPVRVRVEPGEKPGSQTIVFIGNLAGDFDLRDALERDDGAAATDLPPMPVHVVSRLPGDHAGEFFGQDDRPALTGGGYSAALVVLGVAWALVPVVVLVRRALRPKAPPPSQATPAREPTLGERLALAIADAGGREMSPRERAGLELLVIRFLCEQSGQAMAPEADYAQTLRSLREAPRTGPVLIAIERWLHAAGSQPERVIAGRDAIAAIASLGGVASRSSNEAALAANAALAEPATSQGVHA